MPDQHFSWITWCLRWQGMDEPLPRTGPHAQAADTQATRTRAKAARRRRAREARKARKEAISSRQEAICRSVVLLFWEEGARETGL